MVLVSADQKVIHPGDNVKPAVLYLEEEGASSPITLPADTWAGPKSPSRVAELSCWLQLWRIECKQSVRWSWNFIVLDGCSNKR